MTRRTMLTALASAALLPFTPIAIHAEEDPLTATIVALEHLSWDISKTHDVQAAENLLTEDFFEVLADRSISDKAGLVGLVASGEFTVNRYHFSEVAVYGITPTRAIINYRIKVNYDFFGENYTDDLRVTSSYVLVNGEWKCSSYVEFRVPPERPVRPPHPGHPNHPMCGKG